MKISVVVTTYNAPDFLDLVLNSLEAVEHHNFEIVIADDGSTPETAELISNHQQRSRIPLLHAWQADKGFRAASARNNAVRMSSGDYLIFLDGDCLVRPDWLRRHEALAEEGFFVAGNRVLFNEAITKALRVKAVPFDLERREVSCNLNKSLPLLYLPLGGLRKLGASSWKNVKTCNLGVWRKDFEAVNGFDENFVGWGLEDSDLAVRLLNLGVRRKLGLFATTVLHLYHHENPRNHLERNREMLEARIASKVTKITNGLIKPDAPLTPPSA